MSGSIVVDGGARLTLRRPDDWHLHLRDGPHLSAVLPFTARQFRRAVVMPNLKPPITTVERATDYRARILAARPAGSDFEPLMTLYLTDTTAPDEIRKARDSRYIIGAKLYPAGATTHSDAGVTAIERIYPVLMAMQEVGLTLQVHGEVTQPESDVFDREHLFIERVLAPVVRDFPRLRIVFEHVTTRTAVAFVKRSSPLLGATITPQHLLLNRNALFTGGIRPHHYCLPVLKRESDRLALVEAAVGDDPRFFLGTDSAPHARHTKEHACGCAGIFSAHAAIELYAEVFEQAGRLDRLEAFAAERGADFYGLPRNAGTVTLLKESWTPPAAYAYGEDSLVPFRTGELVHWRLADPAVP